MASFDSLGAPRRDRNGCTHGPGTACTERNSRSLFLIAIGGANWDNVVLLLVPQPCPADRDEMAEQFAMGTLTEVDAATFEEHLILCADCAQATEDATAYVRAMSEVARNLRAGVDPPSDA
jgi:hypothetical protein